MTNRTVGIVAAVAVVLLAANLFVGVPVGTP